ncbi:hypothetical protein SAMN06265367_103250 [Algoriphagus winogradskyi]|jgi:hypothetical protein|uniref:Uncharacterized protein n=1 Tax=Algoriphagus winogradskyi TaxID=237017 RepID=A0ABY1NZ08_9BACT|nr:hypothetical protein SAMN06265367_103250 [Algoriphagus winogradskyi]
MVNANEVSVLDFFTKLAAILLDRDNKKYVIALTEKGNYM